MRFGKEVLLCHYCFALWRVKKSSIFSFFIKQKLALKTVCRDIPEVGLNLGTDSHVYTHGCLYATVIGDVTMGSCS
jgi:hypothetical protein